MLTTQYDINDFINLTLYIKNIKTYFIKIKPNSKIYFSTFGLELENVSIHQL